MGAFADYVRAGFALVGLPRGEKAPRYASWNVNPVPLDAADGLEGAGILHVQSGTAALDIDDLGLAVPWLAERGVDLEALLASRDAVRIESGRPGRAKLLYRLRRALPTQKPAGSGLELRCATADLTKSLHDVLPPSLHPVTGKPYRWVYGEALLGDWRRPPPIPATLLALWRTLLAENPSPNPDAHANGHDLGLSLDALQQWVAKQDPNLPYDEWVRVGMKLHDATGGAEEGLAVWDAWSAKATRTDSAGRPVYSGPATCRVHWVSFQSTPGKVVASLKHELPATADEFDFVEADDLLSVEEKKQGKLAADKKSEAAKKAAHDKLVKSAIARLEEQLVYVLPLEKYFDTVHQRMIQTDAGIKHQFTSMMPWNQKGTARYNPVKVLEQSSTKTIVDGLAFHPGEGALFKHRGDMFANSFRDRAPEPIEPTPLEVEKIEWIFARIDDALYRRWLLQFYGHVVQHPATKIKTAPLLWSEIEQNGKSTIVKKIPKLLVGAEYSSDADYAALNQPFNDYIIGKWHVNLQEFRAGRQDERTMIHNKVKAYITDDDVSANPKGLASYTMPNHFFVTASSNNPDAAAIGSNDERWGVHEFNQPKYTEAEVQWIYHEFLNLERAAAVLRHYFLHVDLTGFSPTASPPATQSKLKMIAASQPQDLETLQTLYEERALFFERDVVKVSDVTDYMRRTFRYATAARVGRTLAKPPFHGVSKLYRSGSAVYRCVVLRNHNMWLNASGKQVIDYINGFDDAIEVEKDDLLL